MRSVFFVIFLIVFMLTSCELSKYNNFKDQDIADEHVDEDVVDKDVIDEDIIDEDIIDEDIVDEDTIDEDIIDEDIIDEDIIDEDIIDEDIIDEDIVDEDIVDEDSLDDDSDIDVLPSGYVILTFDDLLLQGWKEANELFFKPENIPATFYLSRIYSVSPDSKENETLLTFQDFGHELANHTYSHINALEYVENNSIEKYELEEIGSVNTYAETLGLNISKNIAYPFGSSNSDIDNYLLDKYKTVRYYNYSDNLQTFKPEDTILNCYPIDAYYNENSGYYFGSSQISKLKSLFDKASSSGEAAILCGHIIKPTLPNTSSGMLTSITFLELIKKYAEERKLEFTTVDKYFVTNDPGNDDSDSIETDDDSIEINDTDFIESDSDIIEINDRDNL